jgi:hypothetical protein
MQLTSVFEQEKAMGAGLVIDDGGSTRIKWMKKESGETIFGKLKNIMTVVGLEGNKKSTQEIVDDVYTQLRIVWQDRRGHPTEIEHGSFHDILISSQLKQYVRVENTGSGLRISLFGDVIEPIVEARQQELRRRYIVTNSGRIEKVTVDGKDVFDITNFTKDDPQFVIYTSVVLT